jgi:hypothetical protein
MEKGPAPQGGAQRSMNNPGAAKNDAANPGSRDEPRTGQAETREQPRTGQAEQKREQPRTEQAEEKRDQPGTGQANENRDQPRTGQTVERRDEPRARQNAETRGETQNGANAANREGDRGGNAGDRARNVKVAGNLHVTEDNAARISDNLMRRGPSESVNVHVHVDVGAPLPGKVDLLPLPPDIVELAPEYQGYDYVVVNDEIVFVQPSTRRVVRIIVAGDEPGRHLAGARPCPVD